MMTGSFTQFSLTSRSEIILILVPAKGEVTLYLKSASDESQQAVLIPIPTQY